MDARGTETVKTTDTSCHRMASVAAKRELWTVYSVWQYWW